MYVHQLCQSTMPMLNHKCHLSFVKYLSNFLPPLCSQLSYLPQSATIARTRSVYHFTVVQCRRLGNITQRNVLLCIEHYSPLILVQPQADLLRQKDLSRGCRRQARRRMEGEITIVRYLASQHALENQAP